MKKLHKLTLSLLATSILTACGGSGGSDFSEAPTNTSPSVTVQNLSIFENQLIELPAIATDKESDVSYSWSVSGMSGIELIDVNSDVLKFKAPSISVDMADITASVTVTDGSGLTDSHTAIVTIKNNVPVVAIVGPESLLEKSSESFSLSISGGDELANIEWSVNDSEHFTVDNQNNSAELILSALALSEDKLVSVTVNVTDIDGDTSSAILNVQANHIFEELTLIGVATDNPLANATIQVLIGTTTYETTADENGQYEIALTIDDDILSDIVILKAFGAAEQENIMLVSVLGKAGDLVVDAGSDSALLSSDNSNVNITNVTTAMLILPM